VDLIGHHDMVGLALSELRQRLVGTLRAGQWNMRRLRTLAKTYGTPPAIALVNTCVAMATSAEAMPSPDDLDAFVASVEPFARKLLDVQRQARALGIFVDDRELLTCPKCGLTEDVLSDGRLITFSGSRGPDSGLRFIEPTSADGRYTCPRCGGRARSG